MGIAMGLAWMGDPGRACALAALLGVGAAAGATAADARVTVVFDRALPDVPGKSLKGVLVAYGPGGASPPHTHPPGAVVYATVLEGAIRSAVNDGPVRTYRAGEGFAEMPGDRHAVSANASTTRPARLLAVFVVDTDARELTLPIR